VLIVADPASSLSEVQLAKVLTADSSSWLRVRVARKARLAVVFSEVGHERADAADPWLTALDTVTRVRVAPPAGPLAHCAVSDLQLSDSGAPEPPHLEAKQVISAANELELRRALAALNLNVDLSQVAAFAARGTAPFRVAFYDAPAEAETRAERLFDGNSAGDLPQFFVADRSTLPLTLIALTTDGAKPVNAPVADPSEFPITYRAVAEQTDYTNARGTWLTGADGRWLVEARDEAAVFTPLTFSSGVMIDSALSLYASGALALSDRAACTGRVAAAERASETHADAYTCGTADDLARAMAELSYATPRLSRFFGAVSGEGVQNSRFSEAALPVASSRVMATDFDGSACPIITGGSAMGGSSGNENSAEPGATSGVVRPMPIDGTNSSDGTDSTGTSSGSDDVSSVDSGSCNLFVAGSDSCSGDSSSSDSSSDSCSGDSSDPSANDSCSGNSSSDGNDSCSGNSSSDGNDSCSGDSSSGSNSDDSGGCGKSNYDGDTCSGNSSSSDRAGTSSAALEAGGVHPRRPRRVRLSLLSLIGAAFALPLRRRKSSRARFVA